MPEFIHVNSEDTLKKLNSNSKDKLVKYYMDGCGHCDDLEPIWKLVEKRIKQDHSDTDILIVQLNANYMDNADLPNVEGFPTISMIKGGKKFEHKGERTENAIIDFFKKYSSNIMQSGGGKRRKTTKKRKKSSKRKTKRKRSKKGKGPVMSKAKGLMPAKKVQPKSAVFAEAKESDDNYEIARLNREGNRLLNNIRQPPSPWYDTDAAKLEFNQNKRLYERIIKNAPIAEIVEKPKIVAANTVNNSYYNPKTNDGRTDNFTVVSSRRRRGRNTNRIVPISGGTRKKRGGKWSKKYKKSINCKKPKGFSQKQYCKYGRKRGGMRRALTNDMINTFNNPHNSNFPNDCCPCVFRLLGMSPDAVKFYQENFGAGFQSEDLVNAMNTGYPEYNSIMWESPDTTKQTIEENQQLLNLIFSSIPNGYAAIGGIRRTDDTAHCISFAMSDSGQPVVFDAQSSRLYLGPKQILDDWLGKQERNVKYLYILNSFKKDGTNTQLLLDINGNDLTIFTKDKNVTPKSITEKTNIAATVPLPDDDEDDKKKKGGNKKYTRKRTRYRK